MAYADYQYYTDTYKGNSIGPEDFHRLAERASGYIDVATINRAKCASVDRMKAVKMATCAIAEVMQDEGKMNQVAYSGDRPVSSETVGAWSRSYGSRAVSGTDIGLIESRKKEALLIYLGSTGLLRMRGYRA